MPRWNWMRDHLGLPEVIIIIAVILIIVGFREGPAFVRLLKSWRKKNV